MKKYIIRAALHDEANEGWVWQGEHPSRTTIKILHNKSGKRFSVYCQTREIDCNFRNLYNQSPDEKKRLHDVGKKFRIDIHLDRAHETMVMSEWYRDALGRISTTNQDNKTGLVELDIIAYDKGWKRWWGPFRAAAHHPDIVVRLGTRLGVLGAWLGLVGVGIPLLQMIVSCEWIAFTVTATVLVVFFVLGTGACWPPTFGNRQDSKE